MKGAHRIIVESKKLKKDVTVTEEKSFLLGRNCGIM